MSVLLINDYLGEIDHLRQYSGASTEKVISEAFKDLLEAWARGAGLHLIPQHDLQMALGTHVGGGVDFGKALTNGCHYPKSTDVMRAKLHAGDNRSARAILG